MKPKLFSDDFLNQISFLRRVVRSNTEISISYRQQVDNQLKETQADLKKAVKFKLQDVVDDHDKWSIDLEEAIHDIISNEHFHLPFDTVALEFIDRNAGDIYGDDAIFIFKEKDGMVTARGFIRQRGQKYWYMASHGIEFNTDKEWEMVALWGDQDEEGMIVFQQQAGRYLRTLYHFITVLQCENVEIRKVQLPREYSRRKPKQKNLYDYRELVIRNISYKTDTPRGEPTGSTKRTHLRRGHIRRLKSGKTVWVNAHIVKPDAVDQGLVGKHYRL